MKKVATEMRKVETFASKVATESLKMATEAVFLATFARKVVRKIVFLGWSRALRNVQRSREATRGIACQ